MGLELSQIYDLQAKRVDPLLVGSVPGAVAEFIGASLSHVYLSKYSLAHIMTGHPDLSYFDLLCIPFMLSHGLWVGQTDKRNSQGRYYLACVSYINPETGLRYIAGVKSAADGFEIYLGTFHRSKKRQTASMLRRGQILQPHK